MKKFLAAGMLAICMIAASHQTASAWHKSQFSMGLSWSHSSGGNSHCWGAWKNGQVPGPEAFQYGLANMQPLESLTPAYAMPTYAPPYPPQPVAQYPSPYQFATYPQQQYYYPMPDYYYGR